jgi:hypothetical protein
MNRREVAAARGPSNRGPPSPPQTPPAQRTDRDRKSIFHDPNAVRIACAEVRGPWVICC